MEGDGRAARDLGSGKLSFVALAVSAAVEAQVYGPNAPMETQAPVVDAGVGCKTGQEIPWLAILGLQSGIRLRRVGLRVMALRGALGRSLDMRGHRCWCGSSGVDSSNQPEISQAFLDPV